MQDFLVWRAVHVVEQALQWLVTQCTTMPTMFTWQSGRAQLPEDSTRQP